MIVSSFSYCVDNIIIKNLSYKSFQYHICTINLSRKYQMQRYWTHNLPPCSILGWNISHSHSGTLGPQRGPRFKPNGVKLLLAFCQWIWFRGANGLAGWVCCCASKKIKINWRLPFIHQLDDWISEPKGGASITTYSNCSSLFCQGWNIGYSTCCGFINTFGACKKYYFVHLDSNKWTFSYACNFWTLIGYIIQMQALR
jgi:hypothetical protein